MAARADLIDADAHLFLLAKAHLGRYVGPRDRERSGLRRSSGRSWRSPFCALFISVLTTLSGSCFFIGEWHGS
jgi:hypothetical protein